MSLSDFSMDVAPVVQLGVATLGLLGLVFVWYQVRQAAKWNRLRSDYNFLDIEAFLRLSMNVFDTLEEIGISVDGPLSCDDAETILQDRNASLAVKALLNDLENLCAAVRAKCVDRNLAFRIHSSNVITVYDNFRVLIDRIRNEYKDPDLLVELESVALKWKSESLVSIHPAKPWT